MYNEFFQDLSYGKRGEKMVNDALTAQGQNVIDMSNDSEYRKKDIDFRVITKNKKEERTLEVKSDYSSQYTGNFFIEYQNYNNKKRNYKGWYYYCEAEYICFVQQENHKAYIVKFEELKQDIKKNRYRSAPSNDTWGFLVPVAAVENYSSCYCMEV